MLRRVALFLVLALLASGCWMRTLMTGHVYVDSIGDEVEANIAAYRANTTTAVCATRRERLECTYYFQSPSEILLPVVTSTAELIDEFGVFGVVVDPLILQVPENVGNVVATYELVGPGAGGDTGDLDVTVTDRFAVTPSRTVQAEPGQVFLILEFPDDVLEQIAASGATEANDTARALEFDLDLRFEVPELADVEVKPMLTARIDLHGQPYYLPMLPCVTDFADVPPVTIPVSEDPESLWPQLEDLGEEGIDDLTCDGQVYDLTSAAQEPDLHRLSGPERIATAIAVSQDGYPAPGSAGAIVLARHDAFPDALAGTPLAVASDGPLLLTTPSSLRPEVAAEIDRVLRPGGIVYLLGGEAALSAAVEQALEAMGVVVERLWGATRFETAVAIAEELDAEAVFLATGFDFPDALAAGAAAAWVDGVLLLTAGHSMHPATAAYLEADPGLPAYAAGGQAAAAAPDATPLAGADRYATAALVAAEFFPAPGAVGVATGFAFADALSGGVHIAGLGGPVLLARPASLPGATEQYLSAHGGSVTDVYVYGGTAAVSAAVADAVLAALTAP